MNTNASARATTHEAIAVARDIGPNRTQEPMTSAAMICDPCELAHRVSSGIEVTLYWSAADNSTFIEVWQPASDETFAYAVAGERALDAFYHPFAHLPIAPD
jgi:hypothetical protein